jgi:hypothetical protein
MTTQQTAVIVNLTEQSWILHRSYGSFAVSGCAPGEPYTRTYVAGRTALMDLGDKRTIEVPITAREVAEDLAREINSDGGDDSFFGVFVAAGDAPADEELAAARERLAAFYRRLLAVADREWERSHSYLFINDVERRAARYLGIEKEWHYQPRETIECPGCGEKIKPSAAVCKICGAILDRAKAAKLGLGLAPATVAAPVVAAAETAKPAQSSAASVRR